MAEQKPVRSRTQARRRRRQNATSRVTLVDVARAAGVSTQTVSRVINRPEQVVPETAQRVWSAIEALQYVPNYAASQMASNRSGIVAAIIPTISASAFADTVEAMTNVLLPAGYQVLLGNTGYDPDREEKLVRSFLGHNPAGIILAGVVHTDSLVDLLKGTSIPVVETWDWTPEPIDMLVGFSNEQAAQCMVEHLHEAGYRKIVFAGVTNEGDFRARNRLVSFRETVRALELGEPRSVTLVGEPLTMEVGAQALDRVLDAYPDTDAIFFSSDVFASGALFECMRRGISVPSDLAIAGFGDYEIAANMVPTLTSVSVHPRTIGEGAARLLLARMEGTEASGRAIDVGFDVVVRGSTSTREQ